MTRLSLAGLLLLVGLIRADEPPPASVKKAEPTSRPKNAMLFTGLAPAPQTPNACVFHYPVTTRSAECQALCDQALGEYYSYIWMEAARSFETALKHDPDCAYAWLGLHRALEKWGKGAQPVGNAIEAVTGSLTHSGLGAKYTTPPRDYALEQARTLMNRAGHREQLLIQAKLQEKGMWPNVGPDERKKKATATLDELLTLYEDDEEGWFWRAQIAEGQNGPTPFYKALLRINPVHPGANHELVHFYENSRRPALGWPYAEGYMKSSPGMPHAFHMQAHLAMRIGKWDQTTDWSWRAVELERAYHQARGVKPADDHQFYHHMEILTRSLVHNGRFAEAKQIQTEAIGYDYHFRPEWFRMALTEHDWAGAEKIIAHFRKSDKATAAYYAAQLALAKNRPDEAATAIDTLRQLAQSQKSNRIAERRLWEVQGRWMCQTGQGEAGVKLLQRAVDKTKDDYFHHAWAGGAYYMEQWGIAALEAGDAATAAEAFQEALAHDSGSVRGALGMAALNRRLGKTEEADRFMKVARRCWVKASSKDFDRLAADFAGYASHIPGPGVATRPE